MKKLLSFLFIFVLGFALIGCTSQNPEAPTPDPDPTPVKYTVQFYVNDSLYKTLKVEEDKVIGSSNVETPVMDGFEFIAWVDQNQNTVDLDTFKVKGALKLYASFKEIQIDDALDVEGVKEEGVDYYLVVGWWETTDVDTEGNPKVTSSLTPATVKIFYANLKLYLKAWGASDAKIELVQFRNYSSAKVAEMGAAVVADGDVDILIGVGNNINTTAGVTLFEGNEGKTTALMGTQSLSRYVALPEHEEMSVQAISIFDWIKTEVGQKAFTSQLSASEIVVVPERTDTINLTVTIHGLEAEKDQVTVLTSKNDVIAVPEIVVPENHKFLGYATTEGAETAEITAGLGVELTYSQIEALAEGKTELELYPVIVEEVVELENDLDVYVHVTSTSKISEAEAALFALRFNETLSEAKKINFVWVTEGKAADFAAKINEDIAAGINIDVVIGGNATTKLLTAIDEVHINASCGAGHFADTSRKIIVLSAAATAHTELAFAFYDFMVASAPTLSLNVAFWAKEEWMTSTEVETISAGISAQINTLFGVEDACATFNIEINYHSVVGETLAELSAETKTLGVGLVVGTEAAASDEANMGSSIVEQKVCPQTLVASGRNVALCIDNFIYRAVYDTYFA